MGTGALLAVGANGYVWSSSTFASGNINAGNMDFNATWVNPLNANNRSNGFSVRCVQHLCGSCFLSKSMIPKTACHPEWRRPRFAPERSIDSAIRWRSSIPESASLRRGDSRASPAHSNQRLPQHSYGLPPQRHGSPGERRRERLRLVLVVLRRHGPSRRGQPELQRDVGEPAEQQCPVQRFPCALRPASAAVFLPGFPAGRHGKQLSDPE